MSDTKNEPLAAILAEMRDGIHTGRADIIDCVNDVLARYADRIEAAVKRERAQWRGETNAAKEERNRIACKMRYEFAAKCRACKAAPGDAAAMRSVLHDVDAYLGNIIPTRRENELRKAAREALAAPARNCDRFADEMDAQLAFLNDVWLISVEKETMLERDKFENWTEQMKTCYGRWLLAPAKKGGAE